MKTHLILLFLSFSVLGLPAGAAPMGYFTFASDANLILRQNFQPIKDRVGSNFLVGGDSGYPDVSSEFIQVMKKANQWGAKKHVYLEGPGGPTGSGGIAGDECNRMIKRARAVGITIDRNNCTSNSQWLKTWNAKGWWQSTLLEAKYFHSKHQVSSLEIDNLYRAGVESSTSLVQFIRKYQKEMAAAGIPVTLMLKNTTVANLTAILKDINSTDPLRIQRSVLTDFAISEEFYKKDWSAIKAASKRIGISTVTSANTNNYQAMGYF